jgi:hypothetical protein
VRGHPARPDASETLAYPGIARTDSVNAYNVHLHHKRQVDSFIESHLSHRIQPGMFCLVEGFLHGLSGFSYTN